MNVTYWTGFSKRKNSTKTPTATGTDATCVLKDDTSILFPDIDSATIPANANYMYISDFGRYYYVRDVTKVGATRNAFHLEVDPMASYKTQIGSTKAFITFATGGRNDIMDRRLTMKATPSITATSGYSFPWTIEPTGGTYMLTLMGQGGVQTFAMSYSELTAFMGNIASFWGSIFPVTPPTPSVPPTIGDLFNVWMYFAQASVTWLKQFVSYKSAPDCIIDCVWLPISYSGGQSGVPIYLGQFDTAHTGRLITNSVSVQTVNITIPWQYGDWRDAAPYTDMILYVPFLGVLHFDTSSFYQESTLKLTFSLSRCSGDLSVEISAGSVKLGTYALSLKGHYPIGTMVTSPLQQITSIVGGVAGLATGVASGGAGAIVGAALSGGAGAASAFAALPSTVGGLGGGSGAGLDDDIVLVLVSHDTSEVPGSSNTNIGKPVMASHTISTYSGYIQCDSASVDIQGFPQEKDIVNANVNSGFYYE